MSFEHEWMKQDRYDTGGDGTGRDDARRRQAFSERYSNRKPFDRDSISTAAELEEKKRESACTGFLCKLKFWGGKRRTKKRRKKRRKKRKTKSRRKTKRRRKSRRTKRRRRKR